MPLALAGRKKVILKGVIHINVKARFDWLGPPFEQARIKHRNTKPLGIVPAYYGILFQLFLCFAYYPLIITGLFDSECNRCSSKRLNRNDEDTVIIDTKTSSFNIEKAKTI